MNSTTDTGARLTATGATMEKATHRVVLSTPIDHEGWTRIAIVERESSRMVAEILVHDVGSLPVGIDGDLIGAPAAYVTGADVAAMRTGMSDTPNAYVRVRSQGGRVSFGMSDNAE